MFFDNLGDYKMHTFLQLTFEFAPNSKGVTPAKLERRKRFVRELERQVKLAECDKISPECDRYNDEQLFSCSHCPWTVPYACNKLRRWYWRRPKQLYYRTTLRYRDQRLRYDGNAIVLCGGDLRDVAAFYRNAIALTHNGEFDQMLAAAAK